MMDYSRFSVLEFRRKFFKLFGAAITITDPETNTLVGYIKMKVWGCLDTIFYISWPKFKRDHIRYITFCFPSFYCNA